MSNVKAVLLYNILAVAIVAAVWYMLYDHTHDPWTLGVFGLALILHIDYKES